MANEDHRHRKKSSSSSSVCEMSMLLVANIIRLSSGRLFAVPPQPQDDERTEAHDRTTEKPGQGGQTSVRHEMNDVDANADNYISQVRQKINGNHAKTATSASAAAAPAKNFSGAIS